MSLNWTSPKGFRGKSNVPPPELRIYPPHHELQNLATYPGTKEELHGTQPTALSPTFSRVQRPCTLIVGDRKGQCIKS
eukprot:2985872-Rhodomonas_salina.1